MKVSKKEVVHVEDILKGLLFGEVVIKVVNGEIVMIEKKEQFKIHKGEMK